MTSIQNFQCLAAERNGPAIPNSDSKPPFVHRYSPPLHPHQGSSYPLVIPATPSTTTDSYSPKEPSGMPPTAIPCESDASRSSFQQDCISENSYSGPEYWDENSPSCCMGFFHCEAIESDTPHVHSAPSHVRIEPPLPSRSSILRTQSIPNSLDRQRP